MSRIPKAHLETLRRLVELWPESAGHRRDEQMKVLPAEAQTERQSRTTKDRVSRDMVSRRR